MTPYHRIQLGVMAAAALLGLASAHAQVKLSGNTLDTPKHRITIDPSGLPAQLIIQADAAELPLAWRSAAPSEADLQSIGRGPQLRNAARLEAVIGGQTLVAQPAQPTKPVAADDRVDCAADLQAGALHASLKMQYAADGSWTGQLKYGGQNVDLDKLELVFELAGAFDTVIAGPPVDPNGKEYSPRLGELGTAEGVAWSNLAGSPDGKTPSHPGVLTHFFLGTGDRGLTWLTPGPDGYAIDAQAPTMTVERDPAGQVTWRISVVNTPTKVRDSRTVNFTILVHPARTAPAARRVESWKPWTGEPATPALTAAARQAGNDLLRADAATVHEAVAKRALLVGAAGGDARSAAATLADTYPMGLFRYLAASHTALAVQLRPNAARLVAPGASPANDRIALGRALLHDIGVDIAGLSQRAEAANLLRALDEFGYFQEDGRTEFIPYWRSGAIVRYGEEFTKGGAFEVTEENPVARTYASVYLRPADQDASRTKAMIVLVNERDQPTREQLYLRQPQRLFGGPNEVTAAALISKWDFSKIPDDSDWRRGVMIGSSARRDQPNRHLADLEDGGFVQARSVAGGMEIYGLVYIPARGIRVLFGSGAF